jgi:proteic killer suppression protein
VIRSFKHKGLRRFFESGDKSKINPAHAKRLRLILTALQAAVEVKNLDAPGFELHRLTGDKQGFWAVKVSGNWRVIFRFENGDAYEVDYLDYH